MRDDLDDGITLHYVHTGWSTALQLQTLVSCSVLSALILLLLHNVSSVVSLVHQLFIDSDGIL